MLRQKRSVSGAGRTGTKEVAQRRSQAPNGGPGVCLPLSRDERECSKARAKGKGRKRRAKGALVTATRRFASVWRDIGFQSGKLAVPPEKRHLRPVLMPNQQVNAGCG